MDRINNILYKADQIVNHRAEEKERQYGPFAESIERTAMLYNLMKPKDDANISAEGVFRVLIALKLSREAYGHKEDNLLDGVAYIGAMNNYIEEKELEAREFASVRTNYIAEPKYEPNATNDY